MAHTVKRATTYKGTWQGRKGTAVTYYFDSRRDGLRVASLKMDDCDTINVRFIKGDGRSADFKVYASIDCDTQEQVAQFVADCSLVVVTDDIAINTL